MSNPAAGTRMFERHEEYSATMAVAGAALFEYLDDHRRLSGHMRSSSWMMAGGRMTMHMDALGGQALGSTIRLRGRVLGFELFAEEIVCEYDPPHRKAWETTNDVRLLVIGPYRMGFDLVPAGGHIRLRVFIDYTLPHVGSWRWIGRLIGPWYARWCTKRMVVDARRAVASGAIRPDTSGTSGTRPMSLVP